MARPEPKRAHPILWVPSLYFAMGTPMIAVSVVAAIMYKNLGLSNAEIAAYTGAMYLPWVVKPLWAPLLELFRTKRFFVIAMELTLVVTFSCAAFALKLPAYLPLTIALFWISGFASATQDIAGDGVYLTSTTSKEQALYVGLQGAFWNLGKVLVSGALVSLTKVIYDVVHRMDDGDDADCGHLGRDRYLALLSSSSRGQSRGRAVQCARGLGHHRGCLDQFFQEAAGVDDDYGGLLLPIC